MSSVEVDASLLPSRALVDTGVIIRALGDRPDDPSAPACRELVKRMMQARRDVLVSALSIAEILRNDQPTAATVRMPHVPGLTVVAFDERCAVELGAHLPTKLLKEARDEGGASMSYWKFDALLIASALRYKVGVFVTLDDKARRLARRVGVRAAQPSEFLTEPAAQTELFSSSGRSSDSDE